MREPMHANTTSGSTHCTAALSCRDDRGVALTQHARGELFLDSTVALSSDDVAVGSGAFRDGID
ncbi:hypothetical protein GCM10027030_12760 [Luteococcus sediminum]